VIDQGPMRGSCPGPRLFSVHVRAARRWTLGTLGTPKHLRVCDFVNATIARARSTFITTTQITIFARLASTSTTFSKIRWSTMHGSR
jgi:hypothetical protein